jgi:hypothetical protein
MAKTRQELLAALIVEFDALKEFEGSITSTASLAHASISVCFSAEFAGHKTESVQAIVRTAMETNPTTVADAISAISAAAV